MWGKQSLSKPSSGTRETIHGADRQRQAAESVSAGAQTPVRGAGLAGVLQTQLGNRGTMQMLSSAGAGALPGGLGGTLQLKPAMMNSRMGAHMRKYDETANPLNPTQPEYAVKPQEMDGERIGFRAPIEDLEKKDKTGAWTMIEFKGTQGFIRTNKVSWPGGIAGAKASLSHARSQGTWGTAEAPEKQDLLDDANEYAEPVGEMADETTDQFNEGLGELSEKASGDKADKLDKASTGMGVANASVGILSSGFSGLIGMKNILTTAFDNNKTRTEKAKEIGSNALSVGESAVNANSAVSSMVYNASKAAGHSGGIGVSKAVAGWSGSVGEAVGIIKNGFQTVKKIYDLFQKAFSKSGIGAGEAFRDTVDIVVSGLETASSVIKTVKAILDVLNVGTAGLSTAIPALGLAISGATITIKAYDTIKAGISAYQMNSIKQSFKDSYKTKGYMTRKEYFGGRIKGRLGTDKDALKTQHEALKAKDTGGTATDEEKEELHRMREYIIAKEMKSINVKRIDRALVQIGLEMTNMAGDIATLSGAGSHAGVALKVVAASGKAAMPITRLIKQAGRNNAHRWAPLGMVFNAEKSSEKKHQKRVDDTELIMDMIVKLPEMDRANPDVVERYRHVERFIAATGCSLRRLYDLNGDIDAQRALLIKSMAQRE